MTLCPGTSCPNYRRKVKVDRQGNIRVVKRSCYYEPGCTLGWLVLIFHALRRAVR